MADGRTHLLASTCLGFVSAFIGYEAIKQDQFYVVDGILYGSIAIIVTPDYDLEGVTITEAIIRKIPVAGIIWVMLWYPYALLNPHRGRSHTWLGTVERQLYLILIVQVLFVFVVGCQYILGKVTFPLELITTLSYLPSAEILLVAEVVWLAHDILHWIFDIKANET